MSELSKVMIHRKSRRVLAAACWSCGSSDTYCDGLIDRKGECCCWNCADGSHDAHTGLLHADL